MGALGGVTVILFLIGAFIAVLWILLPFAVFGIKDLAKSLISEQKRTNDLLKKLIEQNENKG